MVIANGVHSSSGDSGSEGCYAVGTYNRGGSLRRLERENTRHSKLRFNGLKEVKGKERRKATILARSKDGSKWADKLSAVKGAKERVCV